MKYFGKHWWEIIFTSALVLGFAFGIAGFIENGETKYKLGSAFYETFRLFERKYHSGDISPNLIAAQWILFFTFLWISLKVIITIIAPHFLSDIWVQLTFGKHIVICGLNQFTPNLVNEYKGKKIIVLTEEINKYAESFKQNKEIKLFCGNLSDEYLLQKAKIKTANQLYIVTDSDKQNVEITQSVFSMLKKKHRNNALKCYTLVKDRKLKILLEESALFQYGTEIFEAILFNVNEMGIKYGISMNIDKILPVKDTPPEILIVGLTEKAETIILNLAHCLTMDRDTFRFIVAEENEKIIGLFREKYAYLWDFIHIEFVNDVKKAYTGKTFTTIFTCSENQTEAIKQAVSIRYLSGENTPEIIVFCNDSDILNEILNLENKKITVINLFKQIAGYIFYLEKEIEEKAKTAHHFWNVLYRQNTEWDKLPEHFKQTNRNQILDNYLRTFIATGRKFGTFGQDLPVSFSGKDKETLAMMEHRRWMIEKYGNGWIFGERNNEFKRHNCLIPWQKLSDAQKMKDYDAINLMIQLLNNQTK
jgi:hypothetical protein